MHQSEADAIRASFGEHGPKLLESKGHVHSIALPKIRHALGWKGVRVTKGRVNDWKTVELKYNSLFHRDRHVFGAAAAEVRGSAARQNMRAVVYLDPARFLLHRGQRGHWHTRNGSSKIAGCRGHDLVIRFFPSCLIHRAVALAESKQRRTSMCSLISRVRVS